jgi:hypothetical protein
MRWSKKNTKRVNLDKVYARAIVEGWDKAINLAKEGLPFYDKQIEGDLRTMKAISQRLRNPKISPLTHENNPVRVGKYDRCSCYEYFSKPELGILAPDPDCLVCGEPVKCLSLRQRKSSTSWGLIFERLGQRVLVYKKWTTSWK